MFDGIMNFAGNVMNAVLQPMMERINFSHNLKLLEAQNAYNVDMWKMQNEYNSPQAQMQRFKEAGLNPNLIYGQGSSGNASSAPYQTSRVDAPHYGKAAEAIAKAFNIEELRTLVANRKRAEANATEALVSAADAKDRRAAMRDFSQLYAFDSTQGRYVPQEIPEDAVITSRDMTRAERIRQEETGSVSNRGFFFQQALADDYDKRFLLPYRAKLYGSQNDLLQPQIWMSNFERQHYPVSYWIGQGTKAVHGLSEFTGMFNPSRYIMPMRSSGYFTPFGTKFY